MRSLYFKAILSLIFVALAVPFTASADSISIIPAGGSYEQGKTFSVRIIANSPSQAINAVSGNLSFSPDKLKVVSLSKTDSILNLWVQEPSFSNTLGSISFEGVVPNPGFTGPQGTIIVVNFKTVGPGTATVKFTSGSLLANDGQGTNIAKDLAGASYTITVPKPEEVVPVKATEKPADVEVEQVKIIESINAPVITEYSERIEEGAPLTIGGNTYPNASVAISLRNAYGQTYTQITQSTDSGHFLFLWPDKVDSGEYRLSAIVTYNNVKSLPSDSRSITVVAAPVSHLKFAIVEYTSLILVIIMCIAFIVLLIFFFFHGFFHFKKKIWRDTASVEHTVHVEFTQLRNAVRKELAVLENVSAERDLTKEEARLIEKINKHIVRIEKNINKKVTSVKKDLK